MARRRHCLGIPFAFDCLAAERVAAVAGADPPQALADSIHAAWVASITSGDAGWPAYRSPQHGVMIYDEARRVAQDAMRLEREVWLA
jgi:para-nitrobenzyl esterase